MEHQSVGIIKITTFITTNFCLDRASRPTDVFVTPRMRAFLVAKAHVNSEKPQELLKNIVRDDEGIVCANGTIRKPTASEIEEKGWYDLPGPAKLWPDTQIWYAKHDLEVDPEQTEATIKALAIMESGLWVEGWVKAMIRGDETNPDYSIRWDS
jgi:hypothetical protein